MKKTQLNITLTFGNSDCTVKYGSWTKETTSDGANRKGKVYNRDCLSDPQTRTKASLTDTATAWIRTISFKASYVALKTVHQKTGWKEYDYAMHSLTEIAKKEGIIVNFTTVKKEHSYSIRNGHRVEIIPEIELNYSQTDDEKAEQKRLMLQGHQIAEDILSVARLAMTECLTYGIGEIGNTDTPFRFAIKKINAFIYDEKSKTAVLEPMEQTAENGTISIREEVEKATRVIWAYGKNGMTTSQTTEELLNYIRTHSDKRTNTGTRVKVMILTIYGMTQQEIANNLEISQQVVSRHLSAGRTLAREYLSEK